MFGYLVDPVSHCLRDINYIFYLFTRLDDKLKAGYKDRGHIHSKFKLREHRNDSTAALGIQKGCRNKRQSKSYTTVCPYFDLKQRNWMVNC